MVLHLTPKKHKKCYSIQSMLPDTENFTNFAPLNDKTNDN